MGCGVNGALVHEGFAPPPPPLQIQFYGSLPKSLDIKRVSKLGARTANTPSNVPNVLEMDVQNMCTTHTRQTSSFFEGFDRPPLLGRNMVSFATRPPS